MTNETRIFIEPKDLLAVEFECGYCRASFIYNLSENVVRIISVCPNCNQPFYAPESRQNFEQFFALLKNMSLLTRDSKLTIRLQIRPSASQKLEQVP
jgi:hypothetical protein